MIGDVVRKGEWCHQNKDNGLNFPVTMFDADGGLKFPPNVPADGTYACWGFSAPNPATPGIGPFFPGGFCIAVCPNHGVDTDCGIAADGNLAAVARPKKNNFGGWCGMSRGYEGKGWFHVFGMVIDLSDVEWIASAGGVVPVNGRWSAGTPGFDERKGSVVALVQASGNNQDGDSLLIACLTNKGATDIDINGIAVLL